MKSYRLIIGIDVSKSKLDVCFLIDPARNQRNFKIVPNDLKGVRKILLSIKKLGININDTLFCFENTGVYSMPLACFLEEAKADYWEVPAIEIKRAKGISRGKSDKTDSKDIAFYAHTHMHKLKLSRLPEKDLLKLKLLSAERSKLLKSIQIFEMTHEVKRFIPNEISKEVLSVNKKTLKSLKKILLETEQKIQSIIKENQRISNCKDLIQSVPGVGQQTAIYIIITSKCFTTFSNWRKMACYAGVAPFEYKSGSSIRGRTKVNHMADKKLKALLTMCALSAKKHDKEIGMYYKRKIEEGKNPMLVMNSIKCKVLSRIFATVNRGQPYVNTFKYAA